jgi:alpha-aminoadipate/glutamate carrier protein LysW
MRVAFPLFISTIHPDAAKSGQFAVITLIYSIFLLTERVCYISIIEAIGPPCCAGSTPVRALMVKAKQTSVFLTLFLGGTMVDREHDEEDSQIEECSVCGGDIIIDNYCEEEDVVYCNDCEAEFLIRSLDPLRLKLLDGDIDAELDEPDERYGEDYD